MQLWNNSLHSNMIHLLVSLTEMNYESRPYSLKLKENHTHTQTKLAQTFPKLSETSCGALC